METLQNLTGRSWTSFSIDGGKSSRHLQLFLQFRFVVHHSHLNDMLQSLLNASQPVEQIWHYDKPEPSVKTSSALLKITPAQTPNTRLQCKISVSVYHSVIFRQTNPKPEPSRSCSPSETPPRFSCWNLNASNFYRRTVLEPEASRMQCMSVRLSVCPACMPHLWFARTGPYVTHVEAREEAKTKKPRFRKCGFFVVCPYGVKVWFFRGSPVRAPMSPTWRQGKRQKPKKNTF